MLKQFLNNRRLAFFRKTAGNRSANLKDRVALVTGAASGIGRATALALADAGAQLILCDVNETGLAEVAALVAQRGRLLLSHPVDVADRAAMRSFSDMVHARVAAVDVLINNAGVGLHGGILNTSLKDMDWALAINLGGVVHGCHFFIPKMVARQEGGHVVNVASLFGLVADPYALGYCTGKFAVVGLSEALRAELEPYGIGVSVICPGIISTAIVKAGRYSPMNGGLDEALRAQLSKIWTRRRYPPEKVAAVIVDAISNNRSLLPVTAEAWLAYYLKRFSPQLTFAVGRFIRRRAERLMAGLALRNPS